MARAQDVVLTTRARYSPVREGIEEETVVEGGTSLQEGGQIEQGGIVGKDEDPYAPTPPRTPAPKEGARGTDSQDHSTICRLISNLLTTE